MERCGRPLSLATPALTVLRLPNRGCCFTIPLLPVSPRSCCCQGLARGEAGFLPGRPAGGRHHPLATVADAASGSHHVNLLSGRRYRGANPALLTLGMHLRGSALPYWCGFAEAKALGIFPRKGSKAVHVLRPQVHQGGESRLAESGSAAEGGQGSASADGQQSVQPGRSWVSYRPVALFNAVDLEGEALEALIQKRRQADGAVLRPEPERLEAADAVLSS